MLSSEWKINFVNTAEPLNYVGGYMCTVSHSA